jgi:hypothetical protein
MTALVSVDVDQRAKEHDRATNGIVRSLGEVGRQVDAVYVLEHEGRAVLGFLQRSGAA